MLKYVFQLQVIVSAFSVKGLHFKIEWHGYVRFIIGQHEQYPLQPYVMHPHRFLHAYQYHNQITSIDSAVRGSNVDVSVLYICMAGLNYLQFYL